MEMKNIPRLSFKVCISVSVYVDRKMADMPYGQRKKFFINLCNETSLFWIYG